MTENKLEEGVPHAVEKNAKKCATKQNAPKNKPTGKLHPHPEQLRFAQLLDGAKKEDPKLKDKLKQVVEATQKSMDEAYVALHDCDYDPNRAVNLLLEGIEMGWSTSLKKKKIKAPINKQERATKEETVKQDNLIAPPEETQWESQVGTKPSIGNKGGYFKGRGRGGYQPQRRNGNFTYDNGSPDIIETRYFERARIPIVRPLDTWDPKRPVSDLLNKGIRKYDDEEEYTGSLSRSLVITSSCFGKGSQTPVDVSSSADYKKCITEKSFAVKPVGDEIPKMGAVESEACLLEESKRLPASTEGPENGLKAGFLMRSPPVTGCPVKPLSRQDKGTTGTVLSTVAKGQLGPKIPSIPVEMPPDDGNNVKLMDITFGAIETSDMQSETSPIQSSDVMPPQTSLPDLSMGKAEQGSGKDVLPEDKLSTNFRNGVPKPKSPFYEASLCHNSSPKGPQKPPNGAPFSSEPMYSSTNVIHSSYVPSTTYPSPPVNHESASNSKIHFNALSSQCTQPLPVIQSMPNHYQNVLGTQTCTSNSQYGTSILSPSFSAPYQSYSSMVQQNKKQHPSLSSFSKELDGSAAINSMSFTGTNSPLTMPATNAIPATKPNNLSPSLGKSNGLSNMPTMIGPHQIIVGQGGMPYFQQPIYYQDLHLMQQQRLPTHLNPGYYDVNFPAAPARDGTALGVNEKIFFRADGSLVQHTLNHHPGVGGSNDPANTNIIYGDNFSVHYAGISEGSNGRADNFKSPIQNSASQPEVVSVKPVTPTPKISSYQ